MRYVCVVLLLAGLLPSAVLAQSPQGERRSSSRSRDGARAEELPVKPQPGSPLRLSVKAYRLTDSGLFGLEASVENVSGRDIGIYSIRLAAVGDERPGHEGWGGRLPHFERPGRALRPGQSDVKMNPKGILLTSLNLPYSTFEVNSVVFMDGTIWCADVCHTAESWAGRFAGGRAATDRLRKVLSDGGLDAVVKALREKVAEDDPVPAVLVSTGELVDIVPPRGHTPEWEKGFRDGTKSVADTLWMQYVHHGTKHIERTLNDAYRVEGTK